MSNIREIQVDNTTYDIAAKNLVNGFTQTTAGVNALDAAAGKTLNDNKAPKASPTLYFKLGTQDGDPQTSYPHVEFRSSGNATSGRGVSLVLYESESSSSQKVLIDKDGNFLPSIQSQIDSINNGRLPFYFNFFTIGSNGSVTITTENNNSIWILGAGGNNSVNGIASMRLVNNDAANFHSINAGAGSSTTLSAAWATSTSKLTLSNSGSSSMRCFAFSEKTLTI